MVPTPRVVRIGDKRNTRQKSASDIDGGNDGINTRNEGNLSSDYMVTH